MNTWVAGDVVQFDRLFLAKPTAAAVSVFPLCSILDGTLAAACQLPAQTGAKCVEM